MVDLKKYFDDQVAEAQEAKGQYDTDLGKAKDEGKEEGLEAGKKEGDVAGYARGLAEGKASIELPDASDPAAQYTQQQMNDAVSTARDEEKAAANVVVDKANADHEVKIKELEDKAAANVVVDKANADHEVKIKELEDKAAADLKAAQDELAAAPKVEDVKALQLEVAALRQAIQVEIDDTKKDTQRLEAAMPAPAAPVVPVDEKPVDEEEPKEEEPK